MEHPLKDIRQSGRPDWVLTGDKTDFALWTKHLRALRDRAVQRPTLFEGNTLALKPIKVPEIFPHADGKGRRGLPACTRETISSVKLLSLLKDPKPGDQTPARVWIAEVSATGERVVAKVFCPSFFIPGTQPLGDFDISLPLQQAQIEEAAYAALSSEQGLWVPYFIGRYEVELNHGEMANVLLLEHVDGQSVYDWRASRRLPGYANHQPDDPNYLTLHEEHKEFLKCISLRVTEMHRKGIVHCDLHGGNIIMTDPNRIDSFVFIDFALARDCHNDGAIDYQTPARSYICCYDHVIELQKTCKLSELGWRLKWNGLLRV